MPWAKAIRLPSGLNEGNRSKLPCCRSPSSVTRRASEPSAATVAMWLGSARAEVTAEVLHADRDAPCRRATRSGVSRSRGSWSRRRVGRRPRAPRRARLPPQRRARQEEHAAPARQPVQLAVAVIVEREPPDDTRIAAVRVGHEHGDRDARAPRVRAAPRGSRHRRGARRATRRRCRSRGPGSARPAGERHEHRRALALGRDEAAVGREREDADGHSGSSLRMRVKSPGPATHSDCRALQHEPAAVGREAERQAGEAGAHLPRGVDDDRERAFHLQLVDRRRAREPAAARPDGVDGREREAHAPREVGDDRPAVRRRRRRASRRARAARCPGHVGSDARRGPPRVDDVRAAGGLYDVACRRLPSAENVSAPPLPRVRASERRRARGAGASRRRARGRRGRCPCDRSRTRSDRRRVRPRGRSRRPGCARRCGARARAPASRSPPG